MSYCHPSQSTDFEQNPIIPAVFTFSGHNVRVVLDEQGNPWFIAKDVCKVLQIRNSRDACSALDEDEKGVGKSDTLRGTQEVTLISESGLYTLILRSNKPNAKKFRKWVTAEVLPTLRKAGRYEVSRHESTVEVPSHVLSQMIQTLEGTGVALQQLHAENQTMAPKAFFYDRYRNTQGKHGLQATAKIIGLKPNTFIQQLIADGLLFRRDKCLTAGEAFIKLGWFTTKLFEHPETRMPIHRTMVTPKGLLVFAKQYGWRSDLLTTPQHQ